MDAIDVGVLGATGVVGQQFVSRLARHPWFRCTWLAASERSEGKAYKLVAPWKLSTPIPETSADRIVDACVPGRGPKVVFSGLDASVAGDIERAFAEAGHIVVSNARNFRMDPLVPLLIPEVNADHLSLIPEQRRAKGWSGAIVSNPNCSTIVLALALAPLRAFNIRAVVVSTRQAVSGAGYPGVPSLDILGNVVPFIGGEEEKMERESRKILGTLGPDGVAPAEFAVSVHANRVATVDGHMGTVSVGFRKRVTPDEALAVLRDFRASPRVGCLPSSPTPPIEVDLRPDRPQPRLDLERGRGMAVTVGRVRACPILDLRLVLLGHNTIRGAAGQAVQIAELLVAEGRVDRPA